MAYLLTQGTSYRAIARELGVAYTTVLRMKSEVAELSGFTDDLSGPGRPVASLRRGDHAGEVDAAAAWVANHST